MDLDTTQLKQYEARRVARKLKAIFPQITVDQAFGETPMALAQSIIPSTAPEFDGSVISLARQIATAAGRK